MNSENKKFADRQNSSIDIIGTVILAAVFITVIICLLNSNGTWIAKF